MLRITQSVSSEGATKYFDEALSRGDYYAKDPGIWGGRGAERLGLRGEVDRTAFVNLVSNKMPFDAKTPLTARPRTVVGYDFCWAVPKSLSLYLAETEDKAVELMISEAFQETMAEVEAQMEARVRKGGQSDGDRTTGNMVYASFVHRTTRPIGGISDPHYHVHGYVISATLDEVEGCWKAGQFRNVIANAPFWQDSMNARLAGKLIAGGYGIRRTDRSFELASVRDETIRKFSKRTQLIEKTTRENHVVIDARARALVKETGMDYADAFSVIKSELGAETREKKSASRLDGPALVAHWRSQMTPGERLSLQRDNVMGPSVGLLEIDSAKDLAIEHSFERKSVVRELHLAGMMLRRGIGRVTVEMARLFMKDSRFIRNGNLVTTREVLAEEQKTVKIARAGQGKHEPIGETLASVRESLSAEQTKAVQTILGSRDLVTTLHGSAGTGKTRMAKETVQAIELRHAVVMLAPSASAVEVLKGEGFSKSETFQRFQRNKLLQDVARGQVIWIDEAGFLSARQMHWLVSWASQNGCRVILSGDTRQHHSVDRGDALRVLENSGAVTIASLTRIVRQQVGELRNAVQDLSQGRTAEGFDKLEKFGAVKEIAHKDKRLATIADLHLAARARGESSLIVAPTHAECRAIADAVRDQQRKDGLLGQDHTVTRLAKVNLTTAERRDPISYHPGQIIQFDRRAKGFKVGEKWQVVENQGSDFALGRNWDLGRDVEKIVTVSKDGVKKVLPLNQAEAFNVYTAEQMPLAAGDVVRFTKNGKGFRNNELAVIKAIAGDQITFTDGRISSTRNHLHLDQGIAVTSHASQGKTVDNVIVSAPVDSFSQVNMAQFYVSMSRARRSMHLVTDCKSALREAVQGPSERISAMELLRQMVEETRRIRSQSMAQRNNGWQEFSRETEDRYASVDR